MEHEKFIFDALEVADKCFNTWVEERIIKFFIEYKDWLNKFKALEIFKFISFVFGEDDDFKELNGIFNFENDKYLSLVQVKEAIEKKELVNTLKDGIIDNIKLAYDGMDGVSFRKLLKLIKIDEGYDGSTIDKFIFIYLRDKYIDNFGKLPEQKILDILNGNEK